MYEIRKISRITASGLLISMAISSVAPFAGKNRNIETVAATAQDKVTYAEKIREEIFPKVYMDYRTKRLNYLQIIGQAQSEIENIEQEELSIPNYFDLDVPSGKPFKCYMDANTITGYSSDQYWLKQEYVLDYETGIYTVDGRYCCALGSYYTHNIGTLFDVIMMSGEIIPCILADAKADMHTDTLHQYTVANNTIVEFIVNSQVVTPKISTEWGNTGDLSYLGGIFEGEISYIRIYE